MDEVDLVAIGSMIFNGVGALLLRAGATEKEVGNSLSRAFGQPEETLEQPEETPEQ